MKIEINNKYGKRLKTSKTIVEEDIDVVPVLQNLTITENGTYPVGEGYAGTGAVVVAVAGEVIEEYDGSVRDEITPQLTASGGEVLTDANGTIIMLKEEI